MESASEAVGFEGFRLRRLVIEGPPGSFPTAPGAGRFPLAVKNELSNPGGGRKLLLLQTLSHGGGGVFPVVEAVVEGSFDRPRLPPRTGRNARKVRAARGLEDELADRLRPASLELLSGCLERASHRPASELFISDECSWGASMELVGLVPNRLEFTLADQPRNRYLGPGWDDVTVHRAGEPYFVDGACGGWFLTKSGAPGLPYHYSLSGRVEFAVKPFAAWGDRESDECFKRMATMANTTLHLVIERILGLRRGAGPIPEQLSLFRTPSRTPGGGNGAGRGGLAG